MRKRSNPDSEQNIKRIDTKQRAKKQTHGFQVHFVRGSSTGTRMFSDAVYGGKEQARKAARKYRREVMGDLPPRTTLARSASAKARKAAEEKIQAGHAEALTWMFVRRGAALRVGVPAFDEARCKILRPCLDPMRDSLRQKELQGVDFGVGRRKRPAAFATIEPDKFLPRFLRGIQVGDPP